MLSKQDRAMRAAYQEWAVYYREVLRGGVGSVRALMHRKALSLAKRYGTQSS